MIRLDSNYDRTSPAHNASEVNRPLVESLRAAVAAATLGGPARFRERHVARGKLLPRDRLERLLDSGSALLEVCQDRSRQA